MRIALTMSGLIGLVLSLAMVAGLFLPFLHWQGQSLTLLAIGGAAEGPGWLPVLVVGIALGAVWCCLVDDVPGLLPLGLLYLVTPAFVFGRADVYLGEGAPVAGALPPLAGAPAAIGATVVFTAGYAAMVLGVVDWWTGRSRRRGFRPGGASSA